MYIDLCTNNYSSQIFLFLHRRHFVPSYFLLTIEELRNLLLLPLLQCVGPFLF